ncbi:1-deoxy-D-xylulose-5-phosphate synthase [Fuchsiella alkaliacetigena]|uniref:1-deoxy-D-xylulose-5-phosphate synthase n=1 Tax=Fuchsiella alkaliacetigena TaxID=957042 RepID=UPI00200B27E0|nr:1-deoxy-D-xylulose-5-phosphate synthase [Fuchsiella alkaliacetigena]MCK8825440.1 1-deoxy-D-xylulose-5-phosphate synthase [Fuchsiella alkaliacetigena]
MSEYLNSINSPEDLQELSLLELQKLAEEIRKQIIVTLSETGGHLAPSLGVVELTIALHSIFLSPDDKIIWDVGHQSYAHKLITGRQEEFSSLRQYEGLSGFPKRSESDHDALDTGHSSTSISAALGMACARDLKKDDNSIVAVIGDGALTGGMALEALNHAGHLDKDLIVVLNDNEMSIAKNVGAMSGYLTRLRTEPRVHQLKEDIEELINKIPAIGKRLIQTVERVKEGLKYLAASGILFEELGFTYLGPIDGHNIAELQKGLAHAKKLEGPILVHAITTKGKGYPPAEKSPADFHGTGPFEIRTGQSKRERQLPTYTEIFSEALVDLAGEDQEIVGITAAMPSGTGLNNFENNFPERFYDVGIAEQHAVTLAAGLALNGAKPVVALYSTFLQRAYDQVVHDLALQKANVTLAIDRAGLVGRDGETHQGAFDYSYLRHIPDLLVMAPKDENELRRMLKTAVNYPLPAALRYPRGSALGVELDEEITELEIGKAEVLREGSDLAILAIGTMVIPALEAAEKLAEEHQLEVTVINSRFVKPLDEELILGLAEETGVLLTIEENALQGGFGSAVLELLTEHSLNQVQIDRIGLPDKFIEHGKQEFLRSKYGLDEAGIIDRVLEIVD